ncbi:hypothetical protein [Endozoicomonas sp. YOMI1]|uniref:hypothetical protein n=1 Tax=Endozoicomonas sp. YOMI1 TaxID=2828739 RepID=UPI002147C3BD|nr:hypothetical protein [Endozoicomonas sp. YOMI1]
MALKLALLRATTIRQQFKALIPERVRVVASITANNGHSTSQSELRDGSVITVKRESLGAGEKAFIQDGEIKSNAPDLAQYEVEV